MRHMKNSTAFVDTMEAASHLSLSRATVNRHMAAGAIPCVEIAGRRRIPRKAFNAWCDEIGIDRLDAEGSEAA